MGNRATLPELVVDGLAVWRLTHLLVEDDFPPVKKAREWVLDRYGPDAAVSYLITCVYCTGVWVAGGAALARRVAPDRWRRAALTLATAAAAPIVEGVMTRLEDG